MKKIILSLFILVIHTFSLMGHGGHPEKQLSDTLRTNMYVIIDDTVKINLNEKQLKHFKPEWVQSVIVARDDTIHTNMGGTFHLYIKKKYKQKFLDSIKEK